MWDRNITIKCLYWDIIWVSDRLDQTRTVFVNYGASCSPRPSRLWKSYSKLLGASPVSHARLILLLSSEVVLFMSRRLSKGNTAGEWKHRSECRWHRIDSVNIALNLWPSTFYCDLGLEYCDHDSIFILFHSYINDQIELFSTCAVRIEVKCKLLRDLHM